MDLSKILGSGTAIVLIVFSTGCGGSGGGHGGGTGGTATPTPSFAYVYDSTVQSMPSGSITSGISPTGQWMTVSADGTGYYLNGAFTAFPSSEVAGTNASVVGAGGNYAWASYTYQPPGATFGLPGIAVLNLTGNTIVQEDNASVTTASITPDGTSAMSALLDDIGALTGNYAIQSASGQSTPLSFSAPEFAVAARADSGWTVAYGTLDPSGAISKGRARTMALPGRSKLRSFGASGGLSGALLISPTGVVTSLKGTDPEALAVNDSGISVGFDEQSGTEVGAHWDTSGNETILPKLVAANDEIVLGIADNGVMVGLSAASSTSSVAVLWPATGTPSNLTGQVKNTGLMSFTEADQIQNSGRILGRGTDSSGNQIIVGIAPNK